jgi:hypothetical protein
MKGHAAVAARLLGLALLAIVAVAPAAYSASASSSVDTHLVSGFSGPVTAAPRALDADLSSGASSLHRVRCAAPQAGMRCWVTLSLK